MLVLDTSVIYAAADRRDAAHERCLRLLAETDERLAAPAPTLPELDYLFRHRGVPEGTARILSDIVRGSLALLDPTHDDLHRASQVLEDYADLDVGFVDAAVLAIVERLDEPKLATLDRRHFTAMRPRHIEALELLPA